MKKKFSARKNFFRILRYTVVVVTVIAGVAGSHDPNLHPQIYVGRNTGYLGMDALLVTFTGVPIGTMIPVSPLLGWIYRIGIFICILFILWWLRGQKIEAQARESKRLKAGKATDKPDSPV